MGWYATASEHFRRAEAYRKKWEDYEAGKVSDRPEVNERLEALAAVLRGEVMVHLHISYPGEVMMGMHLAREYGFIDRLTLAHAVDTYPITDILAKTKVIVVVGPSFMGRNYGDRVTHNTLKVLMEAGVTASIQTDKGAEQAKCFREYGSFHIRHGLKEEHALEALTINGAKAMMLDDRIGSIEVGKDADLVLMNGPPFDLYAERIEKVLVDGVVEFERKQWRQTAVPTKVGPFQPVKGRFKAGDRSFAITNAHIFTVSHGNIRNGTMVVEDGKITDVGAGGSTPRGLPVLDVGGRVVLPGFVSARAYPNDWMGDLKWQFQNDENTEPIVPEMDARFAFDPWFPSFEVIRELGTTAQNITPGHLNLIGGRGVAIKTAGMDVEKMVRKSPSSVVFSLDPRSIRYWAKDSQVEVTPETAADMIRNTLDGAKKYLEKPGEYNQRFEALRALLEGEVPAIFQANSVEEIRAALKLSEDYNLRLIVSGGVQAYKIGKRSGTSQRQCDSGNRPRARDHPRRWPGLQRRKPGIVEQSWGKGVLSRRQRQPPNHAHGSPRGGARPQRGLGLPQWHAGAGGAQNAHPPRRRDGRHGGSDWQHRCGEGRRLHGSGRTPLRLSCSPADGLHRWRARFSEWRRARARADDVREPRALKEG